MSNQNVAIFLDFENLAISADAVYASKKRPLQLEPIVDFAATKGNISIKKSYADWSKPIFAQYQNRLMEQGFELVHLPETNSQGKNGSDVRLAIDVMEIMELYPSINTILIGSGDSDFIPLIQRVRARSKDVILIGFEHSVGRLVKVNSAEFKSIEDLIGRPVEEQDEQESTPKINISAARKLLIRYVRSVNTDEGIAMTRLKQDLLRLDPSFSEKKWGFASFKKFVEAMHGDLVEHIDFKSNPHTPFVYLSSPSNVQQQQNQDNTFEEAQEYLRRQSRFKRDIKKRMAMAEVLIELFREHKQLSITQMVEAMYRRLKGLTKSDIRKYVHTLYTRRLFWSPDKSQSSPLQIRPFGLKRKVDGPDTMDELYLEKVEEDLRGKYPSLETSEIRRLLYGK